MWNNKFFASRYFTPGYFQAEEDTGPGDIACEINAFGVCNGTLEDGTLYLGNLSPVGRELREGESYWPVPKVSKRKEIVFVGAEIGCRSDVIADIESDYKPPKYKQITEIIRQYEEDDEEVLMMMF